jgi:hypothetical protein
LVVLGHPTCLCPVKQVLSSRYLFIVLIINIVVGLIINIVVGGLIVDIVISFIINIVIGFILDIVVSLILNVFLNNNSILSLLSTLAARSSVTHGSVSTRSRTPKSRTRTRNRRIKRQGSASLARSSLIQGNVVVELLLLLGQLVRYVVALGLLGLELEDRGFEFEDLVLDLAVLFTLLVFTLGLRWVVE